MRKLTIHREKAFAACLMPIQLYITDAAGWELTINGEKCRKLGRLKNGQTKTFEISGQKAALYAVYGKTDPCFGRCELPCSDEDITVSGKSILDPKKGNPFVFNELCVPEPVENESERFSRQNSAEYRISPRIWNIRLCGRGILRVSLCVFLRRSIFPRFRAWKVSPKKEFCSFSRAATAMILIEKCQSDFCLYGQTLHG